MCPPVAWHEDVCEARSRRHVAAEQIVATIQRRWGTHALRILGAPASDLAIPVVSFGFAEIDTALHIGGLPRGRLTELQSGEHGSNGRSFGQQLV
jgi:RecA/RadA recombinase